MARPPARIQSELGIAQKRERCVETLSFGLACHKLAASCEQFGVDPVAVDGGRHERRSKHGSGRAEPGGPSRMAARHGPSRSLSRGGSAKYRSEEQTRESLRSARPAARCSPMAVCSSDSSNPMAQSSSNLRISSQVIGSPEQSVRHEELSMLPSSHVLSVPSGCWICSDMAAGSLA